MVHAITRKILFADVDAAGILYYPKFFDICHNAFEACFNEKGPFSYAQLIKEHRLGLPAVKAEGNFLSPLQHGDVVEVDLQVLHIGNSSLKVHYTMKDQLTKQTCFEADLTTVCINLDLKKSVQIPLLIRSFLSQLT